MMRGFSLALLVMLVLPGPALAWDPFITTNADVDRATAAIEAQDYTSALEALALARASLPESAELHFAQGSAELGLGSFEEAEGSFSRALELAPSEDRSIRGAIHYNFGLLYARWAEALSASEETEAIARVKWEKAVAQYEALLLLAPDNDDARHNLELTLMQAYPPCSVDDDAFEPNNDFGQARPLPLDPESLSFKQVLRLCPGDGDYFSLPLPQGARVTARVEVVPDEQRPGSETPDTKPDWALYEPDGQAELAQLGEAKDNKGTRAAPVAVSGTYLLGIRNPGDEVLPYELELSVLPTCASIDDSHEPNNGFEKARELQAGTHEDLRICPGDEDIFRVELAEGDSLLVVLQAEPLDGNVMLQLIDEELRPRSGAVAQEGQAIAFLHEPGAGSVYLRVFSGPDGEAPYSLTLQVVPPCPEGNDDREPNEEPSQAQPLEEEKPVLLRICPGDVDLLRYTAPEDKASVIKAAFQHDAGDLRLEILDAAGETALATADKSAKGQDGEALAIPKEALGAETLIRVSAPDPETENVYLLTVEHPDPQQGDQPQDSKDKEQDKEQDQKNKDKGDEQEQNQPEPKPEEEPEQPEPMEQQLEQMNRNPRNLEAERALRSSPFRNQKPLKDW